MTVWHNRVGSFPLGVVSRRNAPLVSAPVDDLIAVCEEQCRVKIPEENRKYMYYILDGRRLRAETTITKPGKLHVCRIVMGG